MNKPLAVTVLTGAPRDLVERTARNLVDDSASTLHAIVHARSRARGRARRSGQQKPPGWATTRPRLARWGEGCGCCTVRSDVAANTRRIHGQDPTARVLLVLQGDEALEPALKTFSVPDPQGRVLSDCAQVQRMVVVTSPTELSGSTGLRALYERIELADAVLLVQDESSELVERAQDLLRALNPHAHLALLDQPALQNLPLSHAEEGFSLAQRKRRSAEVDALDLPTPSDARAKRFVFRTQRPFHPERLFALLQQPWPGVVRAHGPFWVASHPECAATLELFGTERETRAIGHWWGAVAPEQRPSSAAFRAHMDSWHPLYDDRIQELFLAGTPTGVDALVHRLKACLLQGNEAEDPQAWATLSHPFGWPEEQT